MKVFTGRWIVWNVMERRVLSEPRLTVSVVTKTITADPSTQITQPLGFQQNVKSVISTIAVGRALTILKKPGIPIRRDVSEVNTRKCSGCEMCITACPYHARILDSDEKIAVVIEALCQGCGACAMVCPNGAAIIRGLKRGQVYSMIDAAAD